MSTPASPPVIEQNRKLVTVYLDNAAYAKGKMLTGSFADKHGLVEEHLSDYLSSGWKITQLQSFGGGSDALVVRGWIVAVLER